MGFYKKKPVIIEAMQYDGTPESAQTIANWADPFVMIGTVNLIIKTPAGQVTGYKGDWIIKGVKENDFYPCDPETFESTYTNEAL